MTQQEQLIYLLGYIKATIEWLGSIAANDEDSELFRLLVEFEHTFNIKINAIFSHFHKLP